jgi:hypothetical protein
MNMTQNEIIKTEEYEVQRFLKANNSLTHADLGITLAISEQPVSTALLIREMSEGNLSLFLHVPYCKGILRTKNDVHHISEDILNGLDAQVKCALYERPYS